MGAKMVVVRKVENGYAVERPDIDKTWVFQCSTYTGHRELGEVVGKAIDYREEFGCGEDADGLE